MDAEYHAGKAGKIPDDIELIIFDLYGTLIKADKRDGILRDGFYELVEHYKQKRLILFSDAEKEDILDDLRLCKLESTITAVYCGKDLSYERLADKRKFMLKNLKKPCEDFSVDKSKAVFIGDNQFNRDLLSARHYDVAFIQVPQFRESEPCVRERELYKAHVQYESRGCRFSLAGLIK